MIQELFGGGASTDQILGGERKIPISSVLKAPSPSPSPSPSSSIATTPAASSAAPKTSENQNLKCPRCNSPNTKFCYYNNYNLTQPRHFCKTCRRYWTKGGALRNVPIGGGCRQNRTNTFTATSPVGKSISTTKLKTLGMSSDIEKSIFMGGFNHELSSNPILWHGPSQSSHLLASLLRATTQNPNPSFSSNMGNLGLDSMGQIPSMGFGSSFWKNNSQNQAQQEQQQNGGFVLGEIQNDIGGNSNQLYQWLRSSPGTNYYHPDHTTNVASSISPSSAILNSAPVAGGEMGFWNPALSWSDLSTVNGAYP